MTALSPNAWLRYDIVRRELARRQVQSFLDIGCGAGALGSRIAATYDYVGYEADRTSASLATERIGTHGRVVHASLPETPDRQFDAAGAFEVLEHIDDDVAALRAWRRWVRPGGFLFLSTPAHPDRFGPGDVRAGHFRRYSRAMMREALSQGEWQCVQMWMIGWPLGYALEGFRNLVARGVEERTLQERTASSGRLMQPSDKLATLTAFGTLPFRWLQRLAYDTNLGTGLVVLAQRELEPPAC